MAQIVSRVVQCPGDYIVDQIRGPQREKECWMMDVSLLHCHSPFLFLIILIYFFYLCHPFFFFSSICKFFFWRLLLGDFLGLLAKFITLHRIYPLFLYVGKHFVLLFRCVSGVIGLFCQPNPLSRHTSISQSPFHFYVFRLRYSHIVWEVGVATDLTSFPSFSLFLWCL